MNDAGLGAPDARLDAFPSDADKPEAGPEVRDDAGGRPNYMFVTSALYSPGFRSLNIADINCQSLAATARLPGTYRAWLSTTTVRAIDRLAGARGWIRTDGIPFADTVDDIAQGRILNAPYVDERRLEQRDPFANRVMTGTTPAGEVGPDSTCSDWSTHLGIGFGGATEWTTDLWTYGTSFNCSMQVRLYCFGIDRTVPLTWTQATGKLAFLSEGPFEPLGGIEAADALCNAEAASTGLSRRFKALLATSTATAVSRFPAFAQTAWVRADGFALNTGDYPLFIGGPRTPINVTSRKSYIGDAKVFLGAQSPFEAPFFGTCDDWHNPYSPLQVTVWRASSASPSATTTSCNEPAHIYCFEE
jgi:hypothetical protein